MENITSCVWFESGPVTNWDVCRRYGKSPTDSAHVVRFRSCRWRTRSQNGCVTIRHRRSLGTWGRWRIVFRRRLRHGPASSSPFCPPSQIQLGCRLACRRIPARSRESPPSQMSCQCLFLPRRDDKALLFCSERGSAAAAAAAALPWKRLPVALHSLPTVQLHPTPRSLTPPLGPRRHFRFPRLPFLKDTASTRKERKKEKLSSLSSFC